MYSPNQSTSPATAPTPLIRIIDDIETPAPGVWLIGAGQPVVVNRRHGVRRRRCEGRSVGGHLAIADDLYASTIECTIGRWLPRPDDPTLRFAGRLDAADHSGRWRFAGQVTSGEVVVESSVDVYYRGVYRRGSRPVAWLTVVGGVELSTRVGYRRDRLEWLADLNACAPGKDHRAPGQAIADQVAGDSIEDGS